MSTVENNELGVNVWWTIPEFKVAGDHVRNTILPSHGFSGKDIPTVSPRVEVSRAVRSLHDRRHLDDRRISEKVSENTKRVVFGILSLCRQGDESASYEQDTTVIYEKGSHAVTAAGSRQSEVLDAVHSYRGAVTDDDLRVFLRGIISKCHGISKRPTGGIYFVPSRYAHILESARHVVEGMGCGAHLYVEGVMNGSREKDNVWGSVQESVKSEIATCLQRVEKLTNRATSADNQIEALKSLSEINEVYGDLLGRESVFEGLKDQIEEASNIVAQKAMELKAGSAARMSLKRAEAAKTRIKGSTLSLALDVLKRDGESHYSDIAVEVGLTGEFRGKGEIAGAVNAALNKAEKEGLVSKVSRGVFALPTAPA